MHIESGLARTAAGLNALFAWVGLLVQLIAVTAQVGSATEAVWVILRYFTVVTNLLAAVILTGLALALQLSFMDFSESMGNHDSRIVDADRVD